MSSLLRALMLLVSAFGLAAAEPEASAFEVASLCHLNRLRADPAAEARLLRTLAERQPSHYPELAEVDLALFEQELAAYAPLPPLVFDSRALVAARNHSAYMAEHGLGHGEDPGRSGFTGRDLGERLAWAGFDGKAGAENVVRAARGPLHGHLAFVVDWGPGGSGGMQADRGHRVVMLRSRFNVVGIGAVAHGEGQHAVSHAFGIVPGRHLGVVAWQDEDGNGHYDPGEGRPLVVELATGTTSSSSEAGLVTLRLPGRAAGEAVLRCGRQQRRISYPAGILNAWIEWSLPAP